MRLPGCFFGIVLVVSVVGVVIFIVVSAAALIDIFVYIFIYIFVPRFYSLAFSTNAFDILSRLVTHGSEFAALGFISRNGRGMGLGINRHRA